MATASSAWMEWLKINPKVFAAVVVYFLAPALEVHGVKLDPATLAFLTAYLVPGKVA